MLFRSPLVYLGSIHILSGPMAYPKKIPDEDRINAMSNDDFIEYLGKILTEAQRKICWRRVEGMRGEKSEQARRLLDRAPEIRSTGRFFS